MSVMISAPKLLDRIHPHSLRDMLTDVVRAIAPLFWDRDPPGRQVFQWIKLI